jgi:dolichol-phosphate mannosyltransferase
MSPAQPPLVSVIVPTYNERDNIVPLLDQVRAVLAGRAFEVLVVDDDSPDATWQVAEAYGGAHPEVSVLRRQGKRGLSAAIVEGFDRARGAVLAVMDADLSHDPALLPALVDAVEGGADIAVGSRRIPGGGADVWPWHRRLGSEVATGLARRGLGVRLADPMSGYFALRRGVFDAVRHRIAPRGYKILLEIVARADPRAIVELPYVFRDRRQGVSKMTVRVALAYLASLWGLRCAARPRPSAQTVPSAPRPSLRWATGALGGVAVVYLVARYWLATTPFLSEANYDEALTGLMGLAILRGEPQVFYWGQPYLGAIEGYVAAVGFWIAGASTLTLRMTEVLFAFAWVWAVWSITGRIARAPWGLVAGLAVAVPPVFLSFAQLSAHGQSLSVALGAVTLAAAGALLDPRTGPRGRTIAWVMLGLTGGLGWWASQLSTMFLGAALLVLLVARPGALLTAGPYVALGCFALTSLPLWIWNVRHEWATFRHLASWGSPPPPLWSTRFEILTWTLRETLQGAYWDGKAIRMPRPIAWLGGLALVGFYLPGVIVAVARAGGWVVRLGRRGRPWRDPLDVVVLAFWLTVAAHAATWFGTSGVLRYAMSFYATLPILGAVALAWVARRRRILAYVVAALVVLTLGYHAATHVLFVRQMAGLPWRPVDQALATLTQLDARACYADSRIAQVITFESRERIICADYYGLRNFKFLQAVDAIDDPGAVVIVTHRLAKNPAPSVMAAALHRIGAEASVERVGQYVIFHHFRAPDAHVQPIAPTEWRATASADANDARLAWDRRIWTRWATRHPHDAWFQLDLGRVHRVAGISLLVAPVPEQAPAGLRVETSMDGQNWDLVDEEPEALYGVHWWKGHPRLDEDGRIVIRMAPHQARYIRFRHLGEPRHGKWAVAELFVYQAADRPWDPPATAVAALAEARQALAHWMDDPGGPHPKRAPVTHAHRRAQVQWATVFDAANRALAAAPEWEEAHELYGSALALSAWSSVPDLAVRQAQADHAWTEVLRWAEVADAEHPELWRSGRIEARAEALDALGRRDEAAAVRAAGAGRPPAAFHVAFGDEIEIIGLDMPAFVHAGDVVPIRWTWRALRAMRDDYAVVVYLDHETTHRRFGDAWKLGGAFGTSVWMSGERVEHRVALQVPPDATRGSYRVHVVVRPVHATRPLRLTALEGRHGGRYTARLGTLTVAQGGMGTPAPTAGDGDAAHRREHGAQPLQGDRASVSRPST